MFINSQCALFEVHVNNILKDKAADFPFFNVNKIHEKNKANNELIILTYITEVSYDLCNQYIIPLCHRAPLLLSKTQVHTVVYFDIVLYHPSSLTPSLLPELLICVLIHH